MRIFLSLLLASSGYLAAADQKPAAAPAPAQAQQQAVPSSEHLNIDGRQWKVGHEAKEEGRLTKEYVLDNEDVNNWTELFSIQEFNGVPVTPQEFFKLFVDGLKQAVPQNKVESRIIKEEPNVLLGEWWIQDKSPNDQHEWIKIVKDGDEILIVRYTTKKVNDVDNVSKKWTDILSKFNPKKEI